MLYRVILILFFLSGSLALGYQVLWSKFLLDFIGSSSYSYATVLASFMTGIAIGSRILGRYADRATNGLKLYAYLELLIGLFAVIYIPLSESAGAFYSKWVSFTSESAGGTSALGAKLLISFFLLLLPTALMGGTYPLLLRYVTPHLNQVGRRSSQLYSCNAFGAVLGALLTNFALIPLLGLSATLMVFALGNMALGLFALLFAKKETGPQTKEQSVPREEGTILRRRAINTGLALIFVEGLLAFVYEIAWTRYFGIVLGSSSYSFTIMLSAFITGIALGSAILAKYESRISDVFRFWALTQVAVGILALLPLPFYPYLTWLFGQISSLFSLRIPAFYLNEATKLLLCYLIMLPPTVFIGMALPLMVKGLNSSVFKLGKQTGIIYAWNTWGNVAGAVLGGLFLLPWLGVEKLMLLTALATMLLGVAALAIFSDRAARVRFALPVLGLTAIAMVFYLFAGRWDQRWFTTASFRRSLESMDFGEVKKDLDNVEVLLFEDDPSSHLIVTRVKSVNPPTYGIYVNGKADASSSTVDMTTQVLLGQIGLLLHPNPQNVLVVGLATGVTLGSALTHPIAKADVVDIVRKMPMATAYFEPWNHHATSDARTRFIADDARGYLSYTRQKYDVIISEPSNPWVSGVSSLFTKEYYNRASHALSKGGIFVQWLQAYEMSDQTFIAILRTFQSEFPYVYAFQGSAKDLILLGLKAPLAVDFSRLAAALEREPVRGDLGRIGINGVSSFLFLQRLSPGTIRVLSSLSEMENTDDNRFLEYRAPRDFFQQAKPAILIRSDERLRLPSALFWHKWIQSHPRNLGEQTILNFIGRPGIAEDEVLRAFTMMQMFSDPEKLLPQLIAANLKDPSYSTSAIANRIDFLLQQRLYPPAAEFLDQVGSGIILDVSASSERRSSWLALGEQWWNQSRNANQEPVFRGFWIDLLLASGESSKAASQILEWVQSARTPSPEWAFQRIYSLQNEKLTMELAEAYSRKSRHPLVEENRAAASGR